MLDQRTGDCVRHVVGEEFTNRIPQRAVMKNVRATVLAIAYLLAAILAGPPATSISTRRSRLTGFAGRAGVDRRRFQHRPLVPPGQDLPAAGSATVRATAACCCGVTGDRSRATAWPPAARSTWARAAECSIIAGNAPARPSRFTGRSPAPLRRRSDGAGSRRRHRRTAATRARGLLGRGHP